MAAVSSLQCGLVYIPAHIARMKSNNIAVAEINSFFQSSRGRIFWRSELVETLRRLRSASAPNITRYIWGDGDNVSPTALALSTKRDSYLSHGSALWVHGLGGSERQVYVNHEQREKPRNSGELTQADIDKVFKNKPRATETSLRIRRFGHHNSERKAHEPPRSREIAGAQWWHGGGDIN